MILILIDAHSKLVEAICASKSTSAELIDELRMLFAQIGLPETIVIDNVTCFVSAEFETFLACYGIKHLHPPHITRHQTHMPNKQLSS